MITLVEADFHLHRRRMVLRKSQLRYHKVSQPCSEPEKATCDTAGLFHAVGYLQEHLQEAQSYPQGAEPRYRAYLGLKRATFP